MLTRIGCTRFAGVLMAGFASASLAQGSASVTVRGTAWDSLRNAPIAGAFIAITGSSLTAISDKSGRFRFDSVAPGMRTFTMQADALDSIGFTGRSATALIDAEHATVTVAIPSFETLWHSICMGPVPKDSGLVYGSIRDVTGEVAVAGAVVGVGWTDVGYAKQGGFTRSDGGFRVQSNATGRYSLCGVPTNLGMQLRAATDSSASPFVDLPPRTVRVTRRDFRLAKLVVDSASLRTGTIIGTVRRETKEPVSDAIIVSEGLPEVRTSDDGRFVLRGVPVGTHQLEVRTLGMTPEIAIVDVEANDTSVVSLEVRKVVRLHPIKVEASSVRLRRKADFLERKKMGLGFVKDSSEIPENTSLENVVREAPSVTINKLNKEILMPRLTAAGGDPTKVGYCLANVFLNGVLYKNQADIYTLVRPDEIAAIEIYNRSSKTPMEFSARGANGMCGSVVIWTKFAFP